ncbi:MAG: lysylphosphatidylglycerol synthase domain-containing protein [Caldilineaceae bacterium]
MGRSWFDRLQPVFILLALGFVAYLLQSQWATLRSYSWQLQRGWLTLSACLMLASWSVEVYIWYTLVGLIGGLLSYGAALRLWWLSALIRYIPGNVWQPLSLTLYCQRYGVRAEITLASIVLYQAVVILAVMPIAACYFQITGNWGLLTGLIGNMAPWLVALTLVPVLFFLIRPGMLVSMMNWLLRKAGRAAVEANLTTGRLCWLLIIAAFNWLLWGACFGTLALALQDSDHGLPAYFVLHLVAVYPVAYVIGLLSLITPSGFGVREGAFYLLLAPVIGGGLVTVLALAMRVWNILGEVVMALLSFLAERRWGAPTMPIPVEPAL